MMAVVEGAILIFLSAVEISIVSIHIMFVLMLLMQDDCA
jgi:hypothetical protein